MTTYERVLSAPAGLWLPGAPLPQGLEAAGLQEAAQAVSRGSSRVLLGDVQRQVLLVAHGSRLAVPPDVVSGHVGSHPLGWISGVVTTDPATRKVDGHLAFERGRRGPREWVFFTGDLLHLLVENGVLRDPVLHQAGFVAVPKEHTRQVRKNILGFN